MKLSGKLDLLISLDTKKGGTQIPHHWMQYSTSKINFNAKNGKYVILYL